MVKQLVLLSSLLSSPLFANEITPKIVEKWLASESDKIEVVETTPIVFVDGEEGYIAGLVLDNENRNGWAGYALVRPKLQQARKLTQDNLGGQYNAIRVIFEGHNEQPTIVELGGAASGQGYFNQYTMWLSFDGWQIIERYGEETYASNAGACGEEFGVCEVKQVFLNFIDSKPLTIAKTTVVRSGKTLEKMQSAISAEVLTLEK